MTPLPCGCFYCSRARDTDSCTWADEQWRRQLPTHDYGKFAESQRVLVKAVMTLLECIERERECAMCTAVRNVTEALRGL